MKVNWQRKTFLELVDHCEGKTRESAGDIPFPPGEETGDVLRLSDGSYVASCGEYDSGYSEDTPGEGVILTYYIGYPEI